MNRRLGAVVAFALVAGNALAKENLAFRRSLEEATAPVSRSGKTPPVSAGAKVGAVTRHAAFVGREPEKAPSARHAAAAVAPTKHEVAPTKHEVAPTKHEVDTAARNAPKSRKPAAHPVKPRKVRPIRLDPPNASWRKYKHEPWRRGYVTLIGHGKQWSGYLVGAEGDVPPMARQSMSDVLSSWRTGKSMLIDERLVGLVADISDEFGGRPIRVVSGYREFSFAPDSKHKVGQAFDFSIPGIPNEILRDYLRSLPDTGVGFYPNSTHVHLDVRDKPTYWVDYSRPGEHPLYAWEKRVGGLTPAERSLAAALESIPIPDLGKDDDAKLSVAHGARGAQAAHARAGDFSMSAVAPAPRDERVLIHPSDSTDDAGEDEHEPGAASDSGHEGGGDASSSLFGTTAR